MKESAENQQEVGKYTSFLHPESKGCSISLPGQVKHFCGSAVTGSRASSGT